MEKLAIEVMKAMAGKTLVTAESCTGGGIGAALTGVPGSSAVFKGGIICYTNEIKSRVLGVDEALLKSKGAVSAPVAEAMASGARRLLSADAAVSVTGLAGPGGDGYGNPVGTVYVGYSDKNGTISRAFLFQGSREDVRRQSAEAALQIVLDRNPQISRQG